MSYTPDRRGVRAFLDSSPELRAALHREAERLAQLARAVAPVETGRYRASIGVHAARSDDGRQVADVVADVEYAADVEYRHGSRRPLTTALITGSAG